jgi:hypothetical protein
MRERRVHNRAQHEPNDVAHLEPNGVTNGIAHDVITVDEPYNISTHAVANL